MLPNFAQGIILVSVLAGLSILLPLWLTYGSHCFLTVLTESSIGDREVRWPDEWLGDWWWKPLYCVGLLSAWITVGGVVLVPLFLFGGPWALGIVGGLYIWWAYPIGILCVMDARNALAVFYVPLLLRLVRHAHFTLAVGLLTLPAGALAIGLVVLALLHSILWAIPAAIVLPPALLLYARCWGRLAWMVINVKARTRRAADALPPKEAAQVTVQDPWAIPQEEAIPELDVELDEPPPEPELDDEWARNPVPYQVGSSAPASTDPDAESPVFSHAEYYADYRRREEARKARAEGRKPGEKKHRRRATFRNAFGWELWPFFADYRTLRASVSLGGLTVAVLVLLRILVAVFPS